MRAAASADLASALMAAGPAGRQGSRPDAGTSGTASFDAVLCDLQGGGTAPAGPDGAAVAAETVAASVPATVPVSVPAAGWVPGIVPDNRFPAAAAPVTDDCARSAAPARTVADAEPVSGGIAVSTPVTDAGGPAPTAFAGILPFPASGGPVPASVPAGGPRESARPVSASESVIVPAAGPALIPGHAAAPDDSLVDGAGVTAPRMQGTRLRLPAAVLTAAVPEEGTGALASAPAQAAPALEATRHGTVVQPALAPKTSWPGTPSAPIATSAPVFTDPPAVATHAASAPVFADPAIATTLVSAEVGMNGVPGTASAPAVTVPADAPVPVAVTRRTAATGSAVPPGTGAGQIGSAAESANETAAAPFAAPVLAAAGKASAVSSAQQQGSLTVPASAATPGTAVLAVSAAAGRAPALVSSHARAGTVQPATAAGPASMSGGSGPAAPAAMSAASSVNGAAPGGPAAPADAPADPAPASVAASAPAAEQPAAPADALAAAAPAAAGTGPAQPPAAQPPASGAATQQAATHTASHAAAPLQPQLAKPLFTLVGAPHGQHVMTLKVSPEDLGPLTVRAHIDAGGVRIELFAPGEVGREAVRGILPELRKELADAGFGASLDLSDHSGPGNPGQNSAGQNSAGQDRPGNGPTGAGPYGAGRDSAGSGPGGRSGAGEPRPGARWDPRPEEPGGNAGRILTSPQTTLDILV